jgi:hypothetical protein
MSAVAVPAQVIQLLELEPHERRSHNRYPIRLQVEYTLLNRGLMERLGYGSTVNVSSNGVLLHADEALPIGRSIKLAIKWPFLLEDECALKLHMLGTIIRSDGKKAAVQSAHYEFRTVGCFRTKGAGSVTASTNGADRRSRSGFTLLAG